VWQQAACHPSLPLCLSYLARQTNMKQSSIAPGPRVPISLPASCALEKLNRRECHDIHFLNLCLILSPCRILSLVLLILGDPVLVLLTSEDPFLNPPQPGGFFHYFCMPREILSLVLLILGDSFSGPTHPWGSFAWSCSHWRVLFVVLLSLGGRFFGPSRPGGSFPNVSCSPWRILSLILLIPGDPSTSAAHPEGLFSWSCSSWGILSLVILTRGDFLVLLPRGILLLMLFTLEIRSLVLLTLGDAFPSPAHPERSFPWSCSSCGIHFLLLLTLWDPLPGFPDSARTGGSFYWSCSPFGILSPVLITLRDLFPGPVKSVDPFPGSVTLGDPFPDAAHSWGSFPCSLFRILFPC
jgi:hypothetical protein